MEILIKHEILSNYMDSEYIKENLHFEILTETMICLNLMWIKGFDRSLKKNN